MAFLVSCPVVSVKPVALRSFISVDHAPGQVRTGSKKAILTTKPLLGYSDDDCLCKRVLQ
jgi:hypothetical protein